MRDKKKIIICSNYAWTIYNFRIPLIKKLKKEGYAISIFTQYDGYEKFISNEVDQIHSMYISRDGINPFIDFFTFINFLKIFIQERPSLVLLFTIKPVIYGSLAAKLLGIKSIVTITGLGTAFISKNWLTRLVKILYRNSLSSAHKVIFQNKDDRNIFIKNDLTASSKCILVPGSGVDTKKYYESTLPRNKKTTFILIARMIKDKGVYEFVEAARKVRLKSPDTHFQLLGPIEVQNRTSISKQMIINWQDEGIIEYLGESENVQSFIENSCCVVLPSYREGISRVLLEGSAMCRPLIASDVPGCREVISNNVTGFICNPKDHLSLAEKMLNYHFLSYEEKLEMGLKGRKKIMTEFSDDIVCDKYLDIVNACIDNHR